MHLIANYAQGDAKLGESSESNGHNGCTTIFSSFLLHRGFSSLSGSGDHFGQKFSFSSAEVNLRSNHCDHNAIKQT